MDRPLPLISISKTDRALPSLPRSIIPNPVANGLKKSFQKLDLPSRRTTSSTTKSHWEKGKLNIPRNSKVVYIAGLWEKDESPVKPLRSVIRNYRLAPLDHIPDITNNCNELTARPGGFKIKECPKSVRKPRSLIKIQKFQPRAADSPLAAVESQKHHHHSSHSSDVDSEEAVWSVDLIRRILDDREAKIDNEGDPEEITDEEKYEDDEDDRHEMNQERPNRAESIPKMMENGSMTADLMPFDCAPLPDGPRFSRRRSSLGGPMLSMDFPTPANRPSMFAKQASVDLTLTFVPLAAGKIFSSRLLSSAHSLRTVSPLVPSRGVKLKGICKAQIVWVLGILATCYSNSKFTNSRSAFPFNRAEIAEALVVKSLIRQNSRLRSINAVLNALKPFTWGSNIPFKFLNRFLAMCTIEVHKRGTTIFKYAQPVTRTYILLLGECSLYDDVVPESEGAAVNSGWLGNLNEKERSSTASCRMRTELLSIDSENFTKLFDDIAQYHGEQNSLWHSLKVADEMDKDVLDEVIVKFELSRVAFKHGDCVADGRQLLYYIENGNCAACIDTHIIKRPDITSPEGFNVFTTLM